MLTVDTAPDEEAIAPFVVLPVPVNVGRLLTGHFIAQTSQITLLTNEQLEALFAIALDGGVYTPATGSDPEQIDVRKNDDGTWDTPNYTRALQEISQLESEELFWKAFLWQSVLGHEGIALFDDAGGGTAGLLKTMRLLMLRKGITVPRLQGDETQQAGPQEKPSDDGQKPAKPSASHKLPPQPTVEKLPQEKRSRKPKKGPSPV